MLKSSRYLKNKKTQKKPKPLKLNNFYFKYFNLSVTCHT